MRWIDLSAYGPARLQVMPRPGEAAAMFVMEGGDAISGALLKSGFRRTLSGLWLRTFEPADAAHILRWLAVDLPAAVEIEADPGEVIHGHAAPAPERTSAAEAGFDAEPAAGPVPTSESPSEESSSEDPWPSRFEAPSSDAPAAEPAPEIAESPEAAAAAAGSRRLHDEDLADAMAALRQLAARMGVIDPVPAAAGDGAVEVDDAMEVEDVGTSEPAVAAGFEAVAEEAEDAEDRDPEPPLDFAWAVTAGQDDARRLAGLESLAARNHVVAKLASGEAAAAAARRIGTAVAFGEGTMRIVAVVRGTDGSGFGGAGDQLVIADPGEEVGALVERGDAGGGAAAA